MTSAAPARPREIDSWRQQNRMIRDVVRVTLNDLTHEDSLVQPRPGGNRLNWVLGHLLWAYNNGLLGLLGQKPVMDEPTLARYARGAPALDHPKDAVDFRQLLTAWNDAVDRVDAGLAALTPEVLDQPAPGSPTGDPNETVRSLLSTVMFHQAYHVGQTALLRRIAGKPGAIR
jgi:hypothetical protein